MKTLRTTPARILKVWENEYRTLSVKHQKQFMNHKITKELCAYRLVDIRTAIHLGKKRYLPDIQSYIVPAKVKRKGASPKPDPARYNRATDNKFRPQARIGAVPLVNPIVWVGNYRESYKETSIYNCSVCASPVIGLSCKCGVAA